MAALLFSLGLTGGLTGQTLRNRFPVLNNLTASDAVLHSQFRAYAANILNPALIGNEAQLKKVFDSRDQLIKRLSHPVAVYISQMKDKRDFKAIKVLDKELKSVGMRGVFAEGEFLELTCTPVFQDEIKEFASDVYRLYLSFGTATSNSLGGEYPYDWLEPQMKMVTIGEELLKKYPDHQYTKKIERHFRDALRVLTDVHRVKVKDTDNPVDSYIVGGISTERFPTGTELSNYTQFVEHYPASRFNGVVNRILETMSEIPADEYGKFDTLHLVTVGETADREAGKEKIYQYLLKDIDIVHLIPVTDDEGEKYVVTYRFYGDLPKAEQALEKIKPVEPGAKIITIDQQNQVVEK